MKTSIIGSILAAASLATLAAGIPAVGASCDTFGEKWISPSGESQLYCPASGQWRDQASAPKITFLISITKGNFAVTSMTVRALDGQATATSNSTTNSFVEKVQLTKEGMLCTVPGTIETGYSVKLTPRFHAGGGIDAFVELDFSDVVGMNTATSEGLSVNTPLTSSWKAAQTWTFKKGDSYVQHVGPYVVKISATNG